MLKIADLVWLMAYPLYQLLGTFRREASHAPAALQEGATIHQFAFWPTIRQKWGFRWGYVDYVGDSGWLTQAAPYLVDVFTCATFFAVCMWIPFKRHCIRLNAVIIDLISPLANSLYLRQGSPSNGVGRLLHLMPPAQIHGLFIASLLLYVMGLFAVFKYSRTVRLHTEAFPDSSQECTKHWPLT